MLSKSTTARRPEGIGAALGALLLLVGLLAACGERPTPLVLTNGETPATIEPGPPATLTATARPSPSATATATPRPTLTPTPTPTPTPLPGASLLAFESNRDGNSEIYLLDTNSGQATNLSRHPAEDRAPAWSPDGQALAFASQRDSNWEIYVLQVADGSLTRLTDNPAYDGAPAWSPDGSQIAFESYRDGNLEIYLQAVGGDEAYRLTDHPAGDYGPAWSPDGSAVVFTSWRDGNKEIYLVPAGGGEAQNLTQHPADDEDPAWSPTTAGRQTLAFVSWRDTNPQTGNRNAEIYGFDPATGQTERLTDNPWPDRDPAWDARGHLTWAAYEPGPPFETYDPYRPGDYHLYRQAAGDPERLTATDGDDRQPAPAPASVSAQLRLEDNPSPGPGPSPVLTVAPGTLARVVEVPSILASFAEQPILANELVSPSLMAWQEDVLQASGWDFLHGTLGSWRSIDAVRQRKMYAYDYGYLSWHKAGRALDLALEYKVGGVDQMLIVREDLGENVYWRLYLRTARQDGSQGEPLRDNPWLYWWHIVPEGEPEAYAAGGKRLPIPAGYYADITALAKRHGWERIAAYAIADDYHWQTDSNGTEYWHYERTDGLLWWEAMQQIYALDTLEQYVGWEASKEKAQSEAMMRSKGLPTPNP